MKLECQLHGANHFEWAPPLVFDLACVRWNMQACNAASQARWVHSLPPSAVYTVLLSLKTRSSCAVAVLPCLKQHPVCIPNCLAG